MNNDTTNFCPKCFESFDDNVESCPDHGTALVRLRHNEEMKPGDSVDDKYEIVGLLGQGGMGTVYKARQVHIGREVALKVLKRDFLRDHKGVRRFVREAQAASMLRSRYSAMLHDFGISPAGFLYYTMELAEGSLLSDEIDNIGPLDAERTIHFAIDICHSLEEAHAKRIVHRDIKPDNIMITMEEGHEIARVLDFGTAKLLSEKKTNVTDVGIVVGTPEYMSPEQAMAGKVDGRSDLYSVGVLMFEMLTGKAPFSAETSIATLLKHVNEEPPRLADAFPGVQVSADLEKLIRKMLAKEARNRPTTALEVRRRLEYFLEELLDTSGDSALPKQHELAPFYDASELAERQSDRLGTALVEINSEGLSSQELQPVAAEGPEPQRTAVFHAGELWQEEAVASALSEDDERASTQVDLVAVSKGSSVGSARSPWAGIMLGALLVILLGTALAVIIADAGYQSAAGRPVGVVANDTAEGHVAAFEAVVARPASYKERYVQRVTTPEPITLVEVVFKETLSAPVLVNLPPVVLERERVKMVDLSEPAGHAVSPVSAATATSKKIERAPKSTQRDRTPKHVRKLVSTPRAAPAEATVVASQDDDLDWTGEFVRIKIQ